MPIYPYQTREVRDLAWACFGPPLLLTPSLQPGESAISNCALQLTDQRRAWLESLDRDARPLLQHLSRQASRRLGLYFEQLWHFFLSQDPEVELLAHNLPVHENGKTLGEFDIIYFCKRRQRAVHLELAVKFFLGHSQHGASHESAQWCHWLGPNNRDRLDLKITHLMTRQIRLGERPEAVKLLESQGIKDLLQEVEIKGYLFNSRANPLPEPPGFNPARSLHEWVKLENLPHMLEQSPASSYVLQPRALWLADFQRSAAGSELTVPELNGRELTAWLVQQLGTDPKPQLVAALDASGDEISRFFVTSQHWPDDV